MVVPNFRPGPKPRDPRADLQYLLAAPNPAMREITGGLLSNNPANLNVPTVAMTPTEKVFYLLKVDGQSGQDNVLKGMDTIAEIETNRENIPNAQGSSARGYFQYMVGNGKSGENHEDVYHDERTGTALKFKGSSFETALNRLDNFFEDNNLGPVPEEFKKARLAKTPMGLSYENQRLITLVDTYNKKGTTALFQKISKGGDVGRKAIDDLYKKSHLVSGSQAASTIDNRNKIIKEKSNLIDNP
jgi:hypothetical protein